MPYETTSPKGHRLQVSDAHLGQRIQCPACNESVRRPRRQPVRRRSRPADGKLANLSPAWRRILAVPPLLAGRPMVAIGLLLVLLFQRLRLDQPA